MNPINAFLFVPATAPASYPRKTGDVPNFYVTYVTSQESGSRYQEPLPLAFFFIPHPSNSNDLPTYLVAHGNGDILTNFSPYALQKMSIDLMGNVCIFDYDGYGLTGPREPIPNDPFPHISPSEEKCLNNMRMMWQILTRPSLVDVETNQYGFGINPQDIILVGHSMGGGVATALAHLLTTQNIPVINFKEIGLRDRLAKELRGLFRNPIILDMVVDRLGEGAISEAKLRNISPNDLIVQRFGPVVGAAIKEISSQLIYDAEAVIADLIQSGNPPSKFEEEQLRSVAEQYLARRKKYQLPRGLVLISTFESAVSVVAPRIGGVWGDKFLNYKKVGAITMPTLFIHDRRDAVIDFQQSVKLDARSGGDPKELILFGDPGANKSGYFHQILTREHVSKAIYDFFDLAELKLFIGRNIQESIDLDAEYPIIVESFFSAGSSLALLTVTVTPQEKVKLAIFIARSGSDSYRLVLEAIPYSLSQELLRDNTDYLIGIIRGQSINQILARFIGFYTAENYLVGDKLFFDDPDMFKQPYFISDIIKQNLIPNPYQGDRAVDLVTSEFPYQGYLINGRIFTDDTVISDPIPDLGAQPGPSVPRRHAVA